jgi:enoyl-CoA hydratase/carnithine racemase
MTDLDMALMCDIRLLAQSARLSEGYIRVGLVPGDGGCYYLPRLVISSKGEPGRDATPARPA